MEPLSTALPTHTGVQTFGFPEQLVLPAGSYTVMKGPSGSGKTTLLNLIAGVSVPIAGTIWVHDTDIFALPEPQRDRFRAQHIGYVFQTFNLLAAFSALENVMLDWSHNWNAEEE